MVICKEIDYYLKYAKEQLELKRIVAVIDFDNMRSIKTAEMDK